MEPQDRRRGASRTENVLFRPSRDSENKPRWGVLPAGIIHYSISKVAICSQPLDGGRMP